jgi:hypothetical protein
MVSLAGAAQDRLLLRVPIIHPCWSGSMPIESRHPHVIHDSQHAPSLANRDRQITAPCRSQHAAVVLLGPREEHGREGAGGSLLQELGQ